VRLDSKLRCITTDFLPKGQPKLGGTTDTKASPSHLRDGLFVFAPTHLIHSKMSCHSEGAPAATEETLLSRSEILRYAQDGIFEDKFEKGEHMNPSSQPNELQEVHLQEADLKTLNETSLPAGQVIAEQSQEEEENLAPRFVP
jgi:hypothetical protein